MPSLEPRMSSEPVEIWLKGLYVGNFSASKNLNGIKNIVCIAKGADDGRVILPCETPRDFPVKPCPTCTTPHHECNYLSIPILDDGSDDILPHLSNALEFLERKVVTFEEPTLVHCMQGVSRSVALCTAFLMKIWRIQFEEAYGMLQEKYGDANISDNFANQLSRFGKDFGWDMEKKTQKHRRYWDERKRKKDEEAKEAIQLAEPEWVDVLSETPEIAPPIVKPAYQADPEATCRFDCYSCRQPLFFDTNVVVGTEHHTCSIFTVERMQWMQGTDDSTGKLHCPKCKTKVGHFSWPGMKCPCGRWHTPAFFIQKSRVDKRQI